LPASRFCGWFFGSGGLRSREANGAVAVALGVGLGARFTFGGDVDAAAVADHGAFALANAAADAEADIHGGHRGGVGFVSGPSAAATAATAGPAALTSDADGLGAGGANFLADLAGDACAVGQAAAEVDVGGAEADGALVGEIAEPELFRDGNALDGAGGAGVAAGGAVQLAVANAEIQDGGPETFDAAFEPGGLDDVGWADADALVTLDAAFEEFELFDGTGRADDRG
jgi:hypothetical protein